jgi:hypothetical protein
MESTKKAGVGVDEERLERLRRRYRERQRWYEVDRSIPLSDQRAHHILSRLKREAA